MNTLMTIIAAALYLLAAGILVVRLRRGADATSGYKWFALTMALMALAIHALLLVSRFLVDDGLNLSFFIALSLTTWLALSIVLIGALSQPLENLAIFVLPFAATTLLLQEFAGETGQIANNLSTGLKVHIFISIASYSLLSIAMVQAVLFYIQERKFRHHHIGGFIRALPPLETMEKLLFQFIGLGYLLLSLSLLTGITFIVDLFEQHLVHKTLLALIAWAVFAVLLWGRWRFGWRGRVAVHWTLIGFSVLMLAYFGSKMVLELILQTS